MSVYTATVTAKGQITLPIELRRLWRLQAGDSVEFFADHNGDLHVRPRNAAPTAFLAAVAPRSRLIDVATDDDAIGAAVLSRNVAAVTRHAAE